MYRLFAALPVPEDLHDGLIDTQTDLPGASWRPAENFHIQSPPDPEGPHGAATTEIYWFI